VAELANLSQVFLSLNIKYFVISTANQLLFLCLTHLQDKAYLIPTNENQPLAQIVISCAKFHVKTPMCSVCSASGSIIRGATCTSFKIYSSLDVSKERY
jgi:hypothetical protein